MKKLIFLMIVSCWFYVDPMRMGGVTFKGGIHNLTYDINKIGGRWDCKRKDNCTFIDGQSGDIIPKDQINIFRKGD